MEEIKIKLSAHAAKAYYNADKTEQQKVEQIVSEVVEYVLHKKTVDKFFEARHALSEEARSKGLTPEMLDIILHEEG